MLVNIRLIVSFTFDVSSDLQVSTKPWRATVPEHPSKPAARSLLAVRGNSRSSFSTHCLSFVDKPKVEGKPADVTVNVDQPAVLECTFSGSPKPEVSWFKDGAPIEVDQRITMREDKPNVHSLHIASAQLLDKSSYICKAKNRFGEIEAKVNLTVNSIKPVIVRDLPDQQIIDKGQPLELQIEVTGLPQPQVKWFKGNEEINPATHTDYQVKFDEKQTYTLLVSNCSPDHQAEYSAQATNSGGTVKSKKSKVTVQKKPEFTKAPQSQTVKDGQAVVFDALIDAYPQPKVTWLKNGKPITPDLGFESQFDAKTGQITLKHKGATNKQSGELICRVENAAGTTDASVTLDVQGMSFTSTCRTSPRNSSISLFSSVTRHREEIGRSRSADRQ